MCYLFLVVPAVNSIKRIKFFSLNQQLIRDVEIAAGSSAVSNVVGGLDRQWYMYV